MPVVFNLAIFAAGVLGAVLIGTAGGLVVPLTMTVFGAVALVVIVLSRHSVYPSGRQWLLLPSRLGQRSSGLP